MEGMKIIKGVETRVIKDPRNQDSEVTEGNLGD